MCTDLVTLSWLKWILLSLSSYYNGFKRSEMSEQGTVGNRTHINSRFLRKLKYVGGVKLVKAEVWLQLHITLDHQQSYDKKKDQLQLFMTSRESMKDLSSNIQCKLHIVLLETFADSR